MRSNPLSCSSVALVVLDGFGEEKPSPTNAVSLAKRPVLTSLSEKYPHALLAASGEAVGLPAGQMGNSEVGHTTIGAGRILPQDFPRINQALTDGSLAVHPLLQRAFQKTKQQQSTLHIMGLTSDGGVHSHITHGLALLQMAQAAQVPRVAWHAFLDGRDTPPKSAAVYLTQVEQALQASQVGQLASMVGRFYAMDRDQHWERTARVYQLLCQGQGVKQPLEKGATAALQTAYAAGTTDEFVEPTVFVQPNGEPIATIQSNDVVLFFNFRADRARQITRALSQPDFTDFVRAPATPFYVGMTSYNLPYQINALFPPLSTSNHLGQYLADQGVRQFRVAETEKYDHITFFFNCGNKAPLLGEERVLVPSRRDVSTHNQAPAMRAFEITNHLTEAILSKNHTFLLANFANPDMVGHTGDLPAAIRAVETIDACLGKILSAAQTAHTCVIITADHGNCETMYDPVTHQPHTAHTTNPVPCWVVSPRRGSLRHQAGLRDVAPTILDLLGFPKPIEMTGSSLFKRP